MTQQAPAQPVASNANVAPAPTPEPVRRHVGLGQVELPRINVEASAYYVPEIVSPDKSVTSISFQGFPVHCVTHSKRHLLLVTLSAPTIGMSAAGAPRQLAPGHHLLVPITATSALRNYVARDGVVWEISFSPEKKGTKGWSGILKGQKLSNPDAARVRLMGIHFSVADVSNEEEMLAATEKAELVAA